MSIYNNDSQKSNKSELLGGLTLEEINGLIQVLDDTEVELLKEKINLVASINFLALKNILVEKGIFTNEEFISAVGNVHDESIDAEQNRIIKDLNTVQFERKRTVALKKYLTDDHLTEEDTRMILSIIGEFGGGYDPDSVLDN